MSGDDLADEEVVLRVLHGQQELYAVLVRRYQEVLFHHAFGMVGSSDAAADLVQDAFVRGYACLQTCQDPARFGGWLFRILRNLCLDDLKNRWRRVVRLDDSAEPLRSAHDPEDDLTRAEIRREVIAALAAIPESQREAFLLKHVDGRSYDEMSQLLGVSVSALKMRVLRAREALQALLTATGEGSERCDRGAGPIVFALDGSGTHNEEECDA